MKLSGFISVVVASLFLLQSNQSRGAVVYNAGADLLANEIPDGAHANPNGAWSYGTAGAIAGPVTLFNTTDESVAGGEHTNAWNGNTNFDGYFVNDANKVAVIAVNTSSTPQAACCGLDTTAPGKIFAHPGPTGSRQFAIVRWTAPGAGTIDINADWIKGDTGLDHLNVLHNNDGVSPLFDFQLTGGRGTAKNFNQAGISVNAGDTIEFSLGNGGTFGSNTVQFDSSVSFTAAPEPTTFGIVALGAIGALGRRRR